MAYFYENGIGCAKNLEKAIYFRKEAFKLRERKANLLGDRDCLYKLGYYYEKGNVVKKDLNKAIEYYKKGAEKGDSDAKKGLERLTKKK